MLNMGKYFIVIFFKKRIAQEQSLKYLSGISKLR